MGRGSPNGLSLPAPRSGSCTSMAIRALNRFRTSRKSKPWTPTLRGGANRPRHRKRIEGASHTAQELLAVSVTGGKIQGSALGAGDGLFKVFDGQLQLKINRVGVVSKTGASVDRSTDQTMLWNYAAIPACRSRGSQGRRGDLDIRDRNACQGRAAVRTGLRVQHDRANRDNEEPDTDQKSCGLDHP